MLQGHCHPKIMKALVEQAEKLTLSSRAFYNDQFPVFAETLTSMFGYDMVLPMNTGAEGVETALKLARKWGYQKKKIPKDKVSLIRHICLRSCFFIWHIYLIINEEFMALDTFLVLVLFQVAIVVFLNLSLHLELVHNYLFLLFTFTGIEMLKW